MNRLTRMLTMAGLGLVTGVTLGAGPAMAATSTDQGSARSTTVSRDWDNDSRVVGYFPNWFTCNRAGEWGDDEGWWDRFFCVRTHSFHDRFALVVENRFWGNGWHGNWGHHQVGQWWSGNNWHGGGNNWWWHHKNKGNKHVKVHIRGNGNPF